MARRMTIRFLACAAGATTIAALTFSSSAVASTHAQAKASGLDKQELKMSMQGDLFEIAGGQLALSRSQSSAVRTLATRLVQDHTKSMADATKVAKKVGVTVPDAPSPTQQWELQVLGTMTGTTFDSQYARLEVADHQQDIEDSTTEKDDGSNSDVTKLAAQDLPMLRQHLALAQQATTSSPT
jgi:putative membrane protein